MPGGAAWPSGKAAHQNVDTKPMAGRRDNEPIQPPVLHDRFAEGERLPRRSPRISVACTLAVGVDFTGWPSSRADPDIEGPRRRRRVRVVGRRHRHLARRARRATRVSTFLVPLGDEYPAIVRLSGLRPSLRLRLRRQSPCRDRCGRRPHAGAAAEFARGPGAVPGPDHQLAPGNAERGAGRGRRGPQPSARGRWRGGLRERRHPRGARRLRTRRPHRPLDDARARASPSGTE